MDRLRSIVRSHPSPVSGNGEAALRCIESCTECAQVCTTCADACLGEEDVSHLVGCIRLNLDCAEVCRATGTLMTRPSHRDAPALRAQLEACAAICRACADECERHAGMGMEHCRVCAESCRACEQDCARMIEALVA